MNIFEKMLGGLGKKEKGITASSEGALDVLLMPSMNRERATFTNRGALSFYEKSVYVNKAIEKRAEKVGEIKFFLKNKSQEEITEHELLNLLAKPNNFQTGEQFFNLWQKYKDLYGEAYVLILKDKDFLTTQNKIELRLLEPTLCEPIFDENWSLSKVKYNNGAKIAEYDSEEVIYDFRPSPANQFRGISLLKAGASIIETNIELDNLNYKLIKNGGKIEGIMNFKSEQMTIQQLDEFKKRYQTQLNEMSEYGNVVFMGGDAEYQRINLTPEELGYMETRKMSLNDICILTDVPKILVNSVDEIKYDNADVSLKMFLTETIKPLMRQITNKLNEKTQLIPQEFELCFIDPTPDDFELKLKLNESGSKNFYLTPNEMRENAGYDAIEGGDDILLPYTMGNKVDYSSDDDKAKSLGDIKHPFKNFDNRRKYLQKRLVIQDRQESIFEKELAKYIGGQKERVISYLKGTRKRKGLADSSFDMNTEISIGKLMLMPLLRQYMERAGAEASELVLGSNAFIWTSTIEETLDSRMNFFLGEINKNTYNKLSKEIRDSLELGESRDELVERVGNYYEETYKGRYETIARTEVHTSVQSATMEGYKQAGMPIKIWVSVLDGNTRDSHAMLDGEERPIGIPFSNGLMFPGDNRGDASETVNCRCSI